MFRYLLIVVVLVAGVFLSEPVTAESKASADKDKAGKTATEQLSPAEAKTSTTTHELKTGGKNLLYTATAGEIPLTDDSGQTEARIFYIAYHAESKDPSKPRPLLFMFNGGPGAASIWLHLGAVGPRRVEMLPDGNMPSPPFQLHDNAYTWLDQADLVFVDPVGTGFSRAKSADAAKSYYTVRGDIESLGKFIRLYLTRNGRWNAPLFLVGESYGTFRCAGLSEYLAEHGMALNGIILVSSVLNLQTISFDHGNDLPYQLYLPTYTATAWYHKRLAPDLQEDLDRTLAAAEEWAGTEYLLALNKGDRLAGGERRKVVERFSRFTGLSPALVENLNLRIDSRVFARELLRESKKTLGIMDSRFVAANVDPSAPHTFDPTITTIRPPFTATFNKYVREELGFQSDLEYFTLGGGIGRWDWEAKNSYADTSENLRNTMAKNRYMKVFVASGLFDLATPHYASEYTMAHLGVPPDLLKNITLRRYRAGHMMYLETESLKKLKTDVAGFIQETLQGQR